MGMRLSCNFVNVGTTATAYRVHVYTRASLIHSTNEIFSCSEVYTTSLKLSVQALLILTLKPAYHKDFRRYTISV